jgi:hypothetical protein
MDPEAVVLYIGKEPYIRGLSLPGPISKMDPEAVVLYIEKEPYI